MAEDTKEAVEHDLKTHPTFFEAVIDGRKPFEVRRNDRNFTVGDIARLREWEPIHEVYTGRECRRTITYILTSGFLGLEPGYVVLGMRLHARAEAEYERGVREAAAVAAVGDTTDGWDRWDRGYAAGRREASRDILALINRAPSDEGIVT